MGGHGAIKGEAWSPSGGWFFMPKNSRPNAMFAFGIVAIASLATYALGAKLQTEANSQVSDATIERWNAAAKQARQKSALNESAGAAEQ